MPFPEFTADGRMTPGIYRGTADEIAERERRQHLEETLRLLVQIDFSPGTLFLL